MGNCKNCDHWRVVSDMRGRTYTECNKVPWVETGQAMCADSFAVYAEASDDSGQTTGLKTGPMFGCVQFKPIPSGGTK